MKNALRIVGPYIRLSVQQELAYRANLGTGILNSLMGLASGLLGVVVIFGRVDAIHGWDANGTLAVFGTWLLAGGFRGLFIGPSLEALSGMGGEIWTGTFDYTLLRPVGLQFHVSVRHWRPLAVLDILFGVGVLGATLHRAGDPVGVAEIASFAAMFAAGIVLVYSILLLLSALVFLSPGFLFTWVFNALFPVARYPLGFYPPWLRILLTWIVPVGVITTVPAGALTGTLSIGMAATALSVSVGFFLLASVVFRRAVRQYTGASS